MRQQISILRAATWRVSLVLVPFLLSPMIASATLLDGRRVHYQYLYNTITTNYAFADNGTKIVGAGVEVANITDNRGTLDISDTNLFVDFTSASNFTPATFNGFRITDILATISDFSGVTINPATNMIGLDASRISFDNDHIWVNWQGLIFDVDTVVSLDITAVPEPSTLVLAGVGLFGLAARRRWLKR